MNSWVRDAVLSFAQNKDAVSPATTGVTAMSATLPTHTVKLIGAKRLALWPGGVTVTPSALVERHAETTCHPGLGVQRVVLANPSGPSTALPGNNCRSAPDALPTSVPPGRTHLAAG